MTLRPQTRLRGRVTSTTAFQASDRRVMLPSLSRRTIMAKSRRAVGKLNKVFLLTDIEGVAGVVSFEHQTYPTGRYYDRAQRLLTAEVNAAVEGLRESGVEEILVADGHGPGAIWF